MNLDSIKRALESGEIQPPEAVEYCAKHLALLDDQIGPLEQTKKYVRAVMETAIRLNENKPIENGYGKLQWIEPQVVESYDGYELDKLCLALADAGQFETVSMIRACKKLSTRQGGIRFSPNRKG